MDLNSKKSAIGFFDSGVGGLSVMREAIKLMPNENYIYFGDSKNAPYGTKDVNEVRRFSFEAIEFLRKKGAKAVVIACNTATSVAISELREYYGDFPIIGIEPALKPAVEYSNTGKIIVMATPMTLSEKKFKNLMNSYDRREDIIPLPCAGLVEFIERGDLQSIELEKFLQDKLKDINKDEISSIVLGCTHYPFVKNEIKKIVGNDVYIIDGSQGTAKELKRRLNIIDRLNDCETKGTIKIFNSSEDKDIIDLSYKLLEI
ncbi:glutamate racemase [Clostridium fallax]|uniref:Glutamate racemase n=1 Tax=Clostridium fallax TaxID=1533 RepID=A0A1M4T6N8_9CLOT|nr:glutamate racemase [Clostridium fallax]SHE40202.1 glutamate racemase [Clostridium fallax]SQB22626.1 glutamate racemase [Clostridium fallax]